MQRRSQGRAGVDQQVVAGLELGLIHRTAERGRAAGSEDRGLRIVDKNVARLGGVGRRGGEHAISFARVSAASAMQIKRKASLPENSPHRTSG